MDASLPERRPSILFLRSSRQCTGLERRILLIARAAHDAGYQVQVTVLYRAWKTGSGAHPLLDLAGRAGAPATQINDPSSFSPMVWARLLHTIRQMRPDIIHSYDYRTDILAFLARQFVARRVRLIATAHGHTHADSRLRLYEGLDRRVLSQFDRVIGVSRYQCRLLREWGLNETRIAHIPNPVEPDWWEHLLPATAQETRAQWQLADTGTLIGYFGRHSPEKGLGTLLDAFPVIRRANPAVQLIVVGDSQPSRRQPASAADIHYIPHQDDIRPLLAACDLIIVPSHREAFGLVALEALAFGKPVIATTVGGLPEIVQDGVTGHLVPPADPESLAAAVLRALADWQATLDMARRGQAYVQEQFGACGILEDVLALYRQTL